MNVNLNINEDACKKYGITPSEAVLLCLYNIEDAPTKCVENLINKGYVTTFNAKKEFAVTKEGEAKITSILLESDPSVSKSCIDYFELAKKLKEIFPKGKKAGTNLYWTDGIPLIVKRLKLFIKKYDYENSITQDQIIAAAQKYVDSFKGDYTFMQLLKYFISKNAVKGGEVEEQSQLLSYIENANQDSEEEASQLKIDWEVELR